MNSLLACHALNTLRRFCNFERSDVHSQLTGGYTQNILVPIHRQSEMFIQPCLALTSNVWCLRFGCDWRICSRKRALATWQIARYTHYESGDKHVLSIINVVAVLLEKLNITTTRQLSTFYYLQKHLFLSHSGTVYVIKYQDQERKLLHWEPGTKLLLWVRKQYIDILKRTVIEPFSQ